MKIRSKVLIGVGLVILVIGITVSVLYLYRHSGQSFVFAPPKTITVVNNGELSEREFRFPNFLPTQWHTAFSVTPLFKEGDVIEIDVRSLEDWRVGDYLLRVDDYPINMKNKDVKASYFFHINRLPESGEEVVRVKIDYVVSDRTIAHRQKGLNGDWFWLREVYVATLVS